MGRKGYPMMNVKKCMHFFFISRYVKGVKIVPANIPNEYYIRKKNISKTY